MGKNKFCYYKKLCSSDIDPVACTWDITDYYYQHKIINDGEEIVYTSWPGSGEVLGTYRMVKNKDKWQVDGITCKKKSFNMPTQ